MTHFSDDFEIKQITEALDNKEEDTGKYALLKEIYDNKQEHKRHTQVLHNQNLILIYGPSGSGKSSLARQFLNALEIVYDRKGQPKQPIKFEGRTVFEIDGKGPKSIDYFALDNFGENNTKEFLVEIPLS